MNPKIYLAKPFDVAEPSSKLNKEEIKFIDTMNCKTPEVKFLSVKHNFNKAYERVPDGLPHYFHHNGVDMIYIFPVKQGIVTFEREINSTAPLLVPFRYSPIQESVLLFEKILVPDNNQLERIIKTNGWERHREKFYIFENSKDEEKTLLEYSLVDTPRHIKYYAAANRIINAVKTGDFSELKPK